MEDFILSTQILTQFDLTQPKNYKIRAIIFMVESKRNLFERNLMGRKMKDWVLESVKPIETTFVELNEREDVFKKAKKYIKDEDFTVCLFSDTPLIKKSTVLDAIEYAEVKDLDFCKLHRGFIVKSKNFIQDKILFSGEANFIDKQEFYTVFDEKTLCFVKNELRFRILEKHLKNGVNFEDLNSVWVDCDVEIGKNVAILQNNILKGATIIKDNVVLEEFNRIENSVINENSLIKASFIKNCEVAKNSQIGPFKNMVDNKEVK